MENGTNNYPHRLSANQAEETEVHLTDYIQVLWRRKRLLLTAFILIVLVTIIYTAFQRPVFKAEAKLEIQENGESSLDLKKMFEGAVGVGGTEEVLNTEVERLKSRPVLQNMVRMSGQRLVLDKSEPIYKQYLSGISSKIGALFGSGEKEKNLDFLVDRESNPLQVKGIKIPALKESVKLSIRFEENGRFRIKGEQGQELTKGSLGKICHSPFFSIKLVGEPPEKGTEYQLIIRTFESAVKYIKQNLSVSPVRNTRLLKISFSTSIPGVATPILTKVITAYKNQKIEQKTKTASNALQFLEDQLNGVETQMNKAVDRLKEFKEKHNLVDLSESATQTTEQLAKIEQKRNEVERKLDQAQNLLKTLQRDNDLKKQSLYALGNTMDHPALLSLGEKLSELQVKQAAALNQYTNRHPKVRTINLQIDKLKEKIDSELKVIIDSLQEERRSFQKEEERIEAQLKELPASEQKLANLQREAQVFKNTYSYMLEKQSELQITKASQSGNIWVVEPANLLPGYVKPKVKRNCLLAIVLGLMLGVGSSFFWEYLDDSVKTPKDLEHLTQIPQLSTVGHMEFDKKSEEENSMIIKEDLTTQFSESFRSLRTNLLFSGVDRPKSIFMVSSALPEAGKSTITSNLAISMASAEKKVLMLEADLRKPVIHRLFNCNRRPGLVDILIEENWQDSLNESIQKSGLENLDLLVCGNVPPNPNEVLSSQKMTQLINTISKRYDFIIIDTPPVLAVSDALILANSVEGIILVVRSGLTTKSSINSLLSSLSKVSEKIVGFVLNDVDFRRERYYYYYHYKYYYKPYYRYGSEEKGSKKKKRKVRKPGNRQDVKQ